jgi:taurine--2-oxoglutarate transaminase
VRELADRYGIVLILDEVMAGFGRTGEWFAFNAFEVVPDLITFAKGVNSGYVPIGGVVISDRIARFFDDRVFPGGLTYSGHPLAAASVVATLTAMEEEHVVENARTIGAQHIGPALELLVERHAVVGDVRGSGVFWAIELVADRETRDPLPAASVGSIRASLIERGLLPFIADNRIHVVPPANIAVPDLERGLAIIDDVLGSVDI